MARRAAETVRTLNGFGVTAQALNADAYAGVLSDSFSPCQTRPAPSADLDQAITAHTTEGAPV